MYINSLFILQLLFRSGVVIELKKFAVGAPFFGVMI